MIAVLLAAAVAVSTPVPAPSPSADILTEIGRVRALTPLCAIARDLVAPSIGIARDADKRFDQVATPNLLRYAKRIGAGEDASLPLFALGRDSAAFLNASRRISDALGDPRWNLPDPAVAALKASLDDLYAVQQQRAVLLWRFEFGRSTQASRDDPDLTSDAFRAKADVPEKAEPFQPRDVPNVPQLRHGAAATTEGNERLMRAWIGEVQGMTGGTQALLIAKLENAVAPCLQPRP